MRATRLFYSVFILFLFTGLCIFPAIGSAEDRRSVSAPVANIRSGPGTNFDILWNAEKYYPFVVIKTSGAWYHFKDFEGDEGWIHKSLVSRTLSVITVKPKCNIRSGPGTRFEILFSVESGVPFKRLKQKGNWIHIEHADGDRGWIHKGLIW